MTERTQMEGREGRRPGSTAVSVLLVCGILSSLLYVATDALAAMRSPGYSYTAQSVSQLLAVGTPTRAFVVPPMTAYNLLILAFGVGVWLAAGEKRALRITGVLLVAYGIASQMGLTLFPLHLGQTEASTGAGAHVAITGVLVLLMLLYMVAGAVAGGRAFRVYSILTIVAVVVFGAVTGMQMQTLAAHGSSPGLGVTERINIFSTMLWVAVFAVALLRANSQRVRVASDDGVRAARPKNVTVLLGSPHKGGATYTAARKFLDDLEAYGDVHGEIVPIGNYDIRACRGCKLCFDRGEEHCPLKDDRDALIEKMTDSDAVVFASPNYSFHVSGVMKVFLDRLGFAFHRPRFHGKTATAIVVQGFYRGREIRKYLEFVAGGLGFNVVRGSVIKTLEPMTEKAVRNMDKALAEQSRRLHDRLLRPAYPAPSLIQLMAFRMSRTGIGLSLGEDQRDYRYYRDHGWFESDFYYPTRLGPFKRAAGALFDWTGAHSSAFKVADEPGGAVRPPSSKAAPQ